MSKSFSQFITTNLKTFFVIFLAALIFSISNLGNFKLDASSDSLVLESDDDLKYYREVNSDYSSSDFLIVIFDPYEDLFTKKTISQVRENGHCI
jgi:predicted RND superfamily exporter protein